MAALIRDSVSRRLLYSPLVEFVAPAYLLFEIRKHEPELRSKNRGKPGDFDKLLGSCSNQVSFIPDFELKPYLPAARTLCTDAGDLLYFAAALNAGADLWSNDSAMKRQKRVRVWTTEELGRELGVLP